MVDITNWKIASLLITICCKSTVEPQSGQEPFVASNIQPTEGKHSMYLGFSS